jgi:hypothetical protein
MLYGFGGVFRAGERLLSTFVARTVVGSGRGRRDEMKKEERGETHERRLSTLALCSDCLRITNRNSLTTDPEDGTSGTMPAS